MLFNSYIFILLFLPLSLAGYYPLNRFCLFNTAKGYILIASLAFYAYFNINYLPIIICSILFNYGISCLLQKNSGRTVRLILTAVTVTANLGVLGYYKYYDFFFANVNAAFGSGFTLHHLILPLAISFFTFQQLSYIIDCYKGTVPNYPFLDYALFVTYFPQLIAGPIVLHDELISQLSDPSKKKFNYNNFAPGVMAFSFGLAKKVLIADTFSKSVDWGYSNISALNSTDAVIVMFAYTIQIYFDFSGYCDMATGIGKMMNIDLPINFNSPYKACDIADFWKRWHMTLTRFFTRYLYIPLGGNRKGVARTYVNMLVIFLVSGLWHGANWTFVMWGALHGVATVLQRMFKKRTDRIPFFINWAATFIFVNITWVFFRAASISSALALLKKIFEFRFGKVNQNIYDSFALYEFANIMQLLNIDWEALFPNLFVIAFTVFALFAIIFMKNTNERVSGFKPDVKTGVVTSILFLWGLLSLAGESAFLYYNF